MEGRQVGRTSWGSSSPRVEDTDRGRSSAGPRPLAVSTPPPSARHGQGVGYAPIDRVIGRTPL